MGIKNFRLAVIASVAAVLGVASTAHAVDTISGAELTARADSSQAAAIAVAARQFSAAAQKWAQLVAASVPWNTTNSMVRIDYAPVSLWASGSATGYAGVASTCGFAAAPVGTTAVPGVASPIKLSGSSVALSTTSQQAQAIKNALSTGGALTATDQAQLLPANFGADWQGVFCGSVKFNSPTANQVQIMTWFAPALVSTTGGGRGGGDTNAGIINEAGRQLVRGASEAQPRVGVIMKNSTTYSAPR